MRIHLIIILVFLGLFSVNSQELNCKITVISSQTNGSNKQIFKTLEKSINEFINNQKWTDKNFKDQEKIQCNLTINITEQSGSNHFKGTVQLQVVRPVYNSSYKTPILNYKDEDVDFIYEEFQPLIYNETSYQSNLTSLLSFYVYVILGFDADSFALKGGESYFEKAESITLVAQQGGKKGWNSLDGNKSRFKLIDNLLSGPNLNYRSMMYKYHIKGMDLMFKNTTKSKLTIANSIISLKNIYSRRPNSFLLRAFLDTKSDEIVSVFKDGPKVNTVKLKEMLMRVYPSNNENWKTIN